MAALASRSLCPVPRHARLAALALAAALFAAAAGAGAAAAAPRADGSPGGVLRQFVEAAGKGDASTMWSLLSARSRQRLGPDFGRFRKGSAAELNRGVGTFARSSGFTVALSTELSTTWAVAVITGSRSANGQKEAGAYGVALRGEGGGWRLELDGPVKLRILGPDPGEIVVQPEPQFAVEVKATDDILGGVLYADGKALTSNAGGLGPKNVTIYAPATIVKKRGVHFGAAIAATATDASAVAWTFGFVPAKLKPVAVPKPK